MDYPRNLYKSPGSIVYNATKSYDTILVRNENELKRAKNEGWIDSFSNALNNEITGEFELVTEKKIPNKQPSRNTRKK